MWARNEGLKLAEELHAAGIQVLVLKGPEVQARLYGTASAYESSDIDILVHPRDARAAREQMIRNGWTFERDNGVLWRLSGAASYERDGFRADLHWGVHAAHLPSWSLRPLAQALWERSTRSPSGFLEPDAESLFVFMAVHATGHDFKRPEWVENVYAAAALVSDWDRAWRIAARARVTTAVRTAMSEQLPGLKTPVLDGPFGRVVWWATYAMRGHVIPDAIRSRLREARALHREGFGLLALGRVRTVKVGDLSLLVEPGVFEPQGVTMGAIVIAERELVTESPEEIIDVGTGSGLVAIAAACHWPDARVHAVDISARAVACARRNALRLGTENVQFYVGDLLAPLPPSLLGVVDVVFSNVPYVSPAGGRSLDDWKAAQQVPVATIYGPGADGLDYMRSLAGELPKFLRRGGLWVFQIGDAQWEPWANYLAEHGFEPIPPDGRSPGHAIVGAAMLSEAAD
jgi:release factor glutamine methyltransferase